MNDKNMFSYCVGRVGYSTIEEAMAKAAYTAELCNMAVSIVDRRTDKVVYTYPVAVKVAH